MLIFGACSPIVAPDDFVAGEPTAAVVDPEIAPDTEPEPETDEEIEGVEAIESGEYALVPHIDSAMNIQSLVPQGWEDGGNGIFARGIDADDLVIFVQQSVQLSPESTLFALTPQLGLDAPPESVGTFEGEYLDWALYSVSIEFAGDEIIVDLAIASAEGLSYLVLLQTPADDHAALYTDVYEPVLNAFSPLETVAADVDLPYVAENVTFDNEDITLAGTLTLPPGPGPHPAVVLVSGSGPQDRDSTLGPDIAIRPFALLADGLTQAGIAVLRYDDRGVGQSGGIFSAADIPDFATDAEAAVRYLQSRQDIEATQVGLIGHSEGAMVGAMLGAHSPELAFVISLAGPGVSGLDVLLLQNRLIMESEGATEEEVEAQVEFVRQLTSPEIRGDAEAIEAIAYPHILSQLEGLPPEQLLGLGSNLEEVAAESARQLAREYSAGWFPSFVEYDAGEDWAQTTIPVLAIFGGRDIQVDPEQNAPAVEAALLAAGNEDFEVIVLPDANHLFQAAETGSLSEYAFLPNEFTPELMEILIEWIQERVDIAEPAEANP